MTCHYSWKNNESATKYMRFVASYAHKITPKNGYIIYEQPTESPHSPHFAFSLSPMPFWISAIVSMKVTHSTSRSWGCKQNINILYTCTYVQCWQGGMLVIRYFARSGISPHPARLQLLPPASTIPSPPGGTYNPRVRNCICFCL